MRKLIALLSLSLAAPFAAASTGYYLVTTYPTPGEKTVDFKYWNAKPRGQPPRSSPELGFGYNVNSRWFTEVSAVWFQLSPGSQKLAAWEWQNDVMLTQGQYDYDLALHTTIEREEGDHALGFEIGPVFQTEIGKTQLNFNVFLQREFRTEEEQKTELVYQWQIRRHGLRWLQFGLQGFGEVGPATDWLPRREQSHRAGPAIFGSIDTGPNQEIRYDAAYLIGKNSGRSAKSVTLRLQYVFR